MYEIGAHIYIYVVSSASHCDWGAGNKLRDRSYLLYMATDITFEPTSPKLPAYYATGITHAAHTSHLFSLVGVIDSRAVVNLSIKAPYLQLYGVPGPED